MSDNPFEKPVDTAPVGNIPSGPQPFPTGLMVVSILCLVCGLFGLLGTCLNGLGLFGSAALLDFVPEEAMPAEARENALKAVEIQFVPGVIQLILGVILSPIMFVGAIGCLTRKAWGRKLLSMSLVGFILWGIFGIGVLVWLTFSHADLLSAANVPTMGEDGAKTAFYVGQVLAILLSLAFMVFYIFSWFYLKKQTVVEFYEGTGTLQAEVA
jgi:hypothetical protein